MSENSFKIQTLIDFEDEMTALFEQGHIRSPLHLSGGNEQKLINIFEEIDVANDWVLCSWRSHFHALLKGVPPEKVRQAIIDGHSISLCFPEHKFLSSGIVGGICPIGVGIAMGIKREWDRPFGSNPPSVYSPKVWVFIGDMTSTAGIFNESLRYAMGHDLPIEFVIEDNGISVCTVTQDAWGRGFPAKSKLRAYQYKLTRPHVGVGKHIRF